MHEPLSSHFHGSPKTQRRMENNMQQQKLSFNMEKHPTSSKARYQRPSEPHLPTCSSHLSVCELLSADEGVNECLGNRRSTALRLQPPAQATPPAQKNKQHAGTLKRAAHEPQTNLAEDACFREQLELIRDAFQPFKEPQP